MTDLFSIAGLAALIFGYVLGSIPFGLLLTRAAGLGDVRKIGSGNIGATNVLRSGAKGLAAATLLLDMLKGLAAVVLVPVAIYALLDFETLPRDMPLSETMRRVMQPIYAAGAGAFLGHLYPVWLKFKGGKGVATYIGVLLGLAWPAALLFCAVWLLVAYATRYSSLSALVATSFVPVYFLVYGLAGISFIVIISGLIFYTHRGNIARLLAGEETKIGG